LLSVGAYQQLVALFTCFVAHKLSHAVHKQRSDYLAQQEQFRRLRRREPYSYREF